MYKCAHVHTRTRNILFSSDGSTLLGTVPTKEQRSVVIN
jgi:hypothetical protein